MEVSDTDFKEKVIEQSKEKLVVVDFWASWCVPCNMLGPVLDEVCKSYGDKVVLAKVNVDECPKTANEYMINAIPDVRFFKDGKVVGEFTGSNVPCNTTACMPDCSSHIDILQSMQDIFRQNQIFHICSDQRYSTGIF